MATVGEALAVALDHHLAGRVEDAEVLYRRILDVDARNAAALHLYGVLCAQTGRVPDAVELIGRAIASDPGIPDYHVNLAGALRAAGQPARAAEAFRQALDLAPDRLD
ncbi:MAG TPA: tetratricopeptide repeat protein, partial [Azospirillum sp.]